MNVLKIMNVNESQQKQDDPLGLRSLPPVTTGEDDWPAIEAALLARHRNHRRWRMAGGGLAAAAVLVLAVTLVPGSRIDESPTAEPGLSVAPVAQETESAPLREPALESLIAMSQQLEGRVRLYRDRFGDLPAGGLVYQVELQDLIVQVDDELSMNPDSKELWGQRVNLLLDVTRLYENSLRRDYQRMASL